MKKIIENIRVERENLIAKYQEVCNEYIKTKKGFRNFWENDGSEEEYEKLLKDEEDQTEKIRDYRYAINDLGNVLSHLTHEDIAPFFG